MNKQTFYNFMIYLPAGLIFVGFVIWVILKSTENVMFVLGAILVLALVILWEKYWLNKSYAKNG